MKFRDKRTGAILEPSSEFVAQQMAQDPNLEQVKERAKRTPAKKETDK